MRISDWSSDVCSSDLVRDHRAVGAAEGDGGVAGVVVFHRKLAAAAARAFGTLRTFRAFRAGVALRALWTFRPGIALRPLGTFRPGVALRAFGTLRAGVALRSGIALRPLWTLRPRRDRVDAVLQRIQPAVDRGAGGAAVVVAAALDAGGGRAEHTAAAAGPPAQPGADAAQLAHHGRPLCPPT